LLYNKLMSFSKENITFPIGLNTLSFTTMIYNQQIKEEVQKQIQEIRDDMERQMNLQLQQIKKDVYNEVYEQLDKKYKELLEESYIHISKN